ncbi:MAG: metallophosphoesterase, partial [Clostridia bacterium]|nr:metallophosphoesterase [Clostridia bacterium]
MENQKLLKPAVIFDIEDELSANTRNRVLVSVHIADLHFPNAIEPAKQYEILNEQFLCKISSLPRLDVIFINGDLFDHKVLVSSDAAYYASLFVAQVVEIAKMKNATVIILHGTLSHDANQLKLYYHYMHNPNVDVRIVTNIKFEIIKGAKVLCIPELYGVSEEVYDEFLYRQGTYDLCVMHGTYNGAVYGNNVGNGRCFYQS